MQIWMPLVYESIAENAEGYHVQLILAEELVLVCLLEYLSQQLYVGPCMGSSVELLTLS